MQAPHHRKIELQSTADLAYLYTNTLNLSHQKLDLHFPPSANNDSDDPMKARVRHLVDDFITKTFASAIPSISINGIDPSLGAPKAGGDGKLNLDALLSTREQVEYEPYDARLAARVTSLYAQLESLTTTVAQMRRDAPAKAAKKYAQALSSALDEDENDDGSLVDDEGIFPPFIDDAEMDLEQTNDPDSKPSTGIGSIHPQSPALDWTQIQEKRPDWILNIPFGNERERERWREGEIAEIYAHGLRTLAQLQGEVRLAQEGGGSDGADIDEGGSRDLAATAGKVERARRAAEVVERM